MKKQPAAASTIARSDIARCAAERKYMPLLLWYHMTIMHEQPQHASMWKRTRYVARTVRLGWMSAQEVAGPGSSEKDAMRPLDATRCDVGKKAERETAGDPLLKLRSPMHWSMYGQWWSMRDVHSRSTATSRGEMIHSEAA